MQSDFIDRIRDATHLEDLIGLELKGHGNKVACLCPFHTEDTPSFTVWREENHWHCFGCNRGGSVFDFAMEREKLEFWEAAIYLANRANIPLPDLTPEEKVHQVKRQAVETLISQYAAACHRELVKHQDILDYLAGRGVTANSMEEYQIGVGVALTKSVDKALAKEAGLTDSRLLGRIIFPISRGGKVVQLSARAFPDGKPKYLFLAGDLWPWNSHKLRADKVILAEGVMDALLLEQAGFPAAATSTHFKADWMRLVRKDTDCYACYDGDEAGAGANAEVAERLFDAGHKAYVITLPEGQDPAAFVQAEGAGAFQGLVDGAKSYLEYLIDVMPQGLNSYELPKRLQLIYSKMASLPATSHERYVARIGEKLKLNRTAIREELRAYLKGAKARLDESEGPSGFEIFRRKTNPIKFNPAQDVIAGSLYYTIHMQTESKAFHPFIVTSGRQYYPLSRDALIERDFVFSATAIPFDEGRWSIGSEDDYNIYDYLDGKTRVEPRELFEKVKWYFQQFLRLPDPAYYDFIPLWCIATYHFRLYDAFGYLFLNAIKSSGKTQALTILSWLAFNAAQVDAITEAGLKRLVGANSATLLNDEAEKLRKKFEDDQSTFFEVWNGGYKKSGRAISINKESLGVEKFCTYSPKALANTQGLETILEDRCITLYFQRDLGQIPQLVEEEQLRRISVLRNMLYCFSLERIEDIIETKKGMKRPDGFSGRDWELWQPIIVLSKFLDACKVAGYSLHERMLNMAIERRDYKRALEEDMNPQARILRAVYEYTVTHRKDNPTGEYQSSELCKCVKDEMAWDYCKGEFLSKFIFEQVHIGKNRKQERYKKWTPEGSRWFYRLDQAVILERAKTMFGVDLKAEVEGMASTEGIPPSERDPFKE